VIVAELRARLVELGVPLIPEIPTPPRSFVWPAELPGLGARRLGAYTGCTTCSLGTWVRYGAEPRCWRCAEREATSGTTENVVVGTAKITMNTATDSISTPIVETVDLWMDLMAVWVDRQDDQVDQAGVHVHRDVDHVEAVVQAEAFEVDRNTITGPGKMPGRVAKNSTTASRKVETNPEVASQNAKGNPETSHFSTDPTRRAPRPRPTRPRWSRQ
jgi:hypothetical protein